MIEVHNGKSVIAIDSNLTVSCSKCIFLNYAITCELVACSPEIRADGRNVHFVKAISKERIVELALKNSFKLKPQPDGVDALNPYVFDFAADLLKELHAAPSLSLKNRL